MYKKKLFLAGWEFELQASQVDKNINQIPSKFLQVSFLTNIEAMLECYISLYELRNSSLREVFLRPSGALEENESIDDSDKKVDKQIYSFLPTTISKPISTFSQQASVTSKIYEKCAMSIFGASKILLVNGAAGTGKTTSIYDLLRKFDSENFQFTSSILVCGMNNRVVDDLAAKVLPKIKNIGEHSTNADNISLFLFLLHKIISNLLK